MAHAYTGLCNYGLDAHAPNAGVGGGLSELNFVQPEREFLGLGRIAGTASVLGVAGRYLIRLFDHVSGRVIREVRSGTDGAYSFECLADRAAGYFVVAFDHGDLPLNAVLQGPLTPTLGDTPVWNLPLLEGQAISGRAVDGDGEPAELVSIRDWNAKLVVANLVPDAEGNWSVTLPNGQYDITYYKLGCAPVAHGPYEIDAP